MSKGPTFNELISVLPEEARQEVWDAMAEAVRHGLKNVVRRGDAPDKVLQARIKRAVLKECRRQPALRGLPFDRGFGDALEIAIRDLDKKQDAAQEAILEKLEGLDVDGDEYLALIDDIVAGRTTIITEEPPERAALVELARRWGRPADAPLLPFLRETGRRLGWTKGSGIPLVDFLADWAPQ